MLKETLGHPLLLLMLIIFGFAGGFVYDLSKFILYLFKNNKIIKQILNFFAFLIIFLLLFLTILFFNYGQIRFFEFVFFFLAFFIQQKTLSKTMECLFKKGQKIFFKLISKIQQIFSKKKNSVK